MNSFDTQIQIEELEEMKELVYYDVLKDEYITESDVWEQYDEYMDCEDNEPITYSQFVNNRLTINNGTLERVGF